MSKTVYYCRFTGDYARDTSHLRLIQHGAYTVLLDFYYSTGKPLPPDMNALCRICRAFDDAERDAVSQVVSQFFELRADGYHNKRADAEIAYRAEQRDRLSKGAKKTNEKRWGKNSSLGDSLGDSLGGRIPSPSPDPQKAKSKPALAPPSPASALPADCLEQETKDAAFAVFWEQWPLKQAKADARRAWMKIPLAEYAAIMSGLEKWQKSDQWARRIIPHPATWLNQKRWQDEDIPQFGGNNGARPDGKPTATDLAIRNAKALGLARPN